MNAFFILVSMIFIVLLEVPRLVRMKYWRELGAFSVILVIAYTFAFLYIFEVI